MPKARASDRELSQWLGPAALARRRWERNLGWYQSCAAEQSALVGATSIGPEHLLLALVAPGEDSVAAQALRQSGIDYEQLRGAATRLAGARVIPGGRRRLAGTFAPRWYGLQGRADGLAAGLGAKRIEAEHLLLALLWEPGGSHSWLLEELGCSRRTIQAKLATLGVKVPTGHPPLKDDTRWGDRVVMRIPTRDAWELASFVQHLLPTGAPFGFNFDSTTIWFMAGEGIDLAPLVRKARRQQRAHQRRQVESQG